ncbi:hypothetical protein MHIB_00130 [Mycolicibacter hiberniae]|uniref:Uncharacterized protein n=1 Tax=Mycolicibacter hiberniae TaxID=29314 RepID=A0A7I7WXM5_9MYCO|nr:hypothetical protein MHIB_00130 [Mycolicibacter hiberniae]
MTMASPPASVATESAFAMAVPPSAVISSTTRWATDSEAPLPSTALPRSFTTTRARGAQFDRVAAAEPSAGTGDDGYLVVECKCHG